ncbi:MAG: hemolysin family protein [Candidatus Eremiobacteraeota bacterium]|nr:hemolysin family protein [Candidatus Eremiobacteraeota bacterium]
MDDSESHLLLVIVPLLILVAMASIVHTTLLLINRSRLKQLVGEEIENAELLSELLNTSLDVVLIVKILHGVLILMLGIAVGFWAKEASSLPVLSILGIIALVVIFFILAELIPWEVIPGKAEKIALKMTRLLLLARKISTPFLKVFLFMISPITRIYGKKDSKGTVTEDDLKMMVEEASEQGILEEEEKEMIHSVFELSNTIAKEIMVPRLDMVSVELKTPLTKVLDTAMSHGYSRIPVYEDSIDRVVGIVHTKDLLALLNEKKMDMPLKEIIRPAFFIPGSKRIDEMLREMQKEKIAMAIVVDEYGGTDGLVTIEDIIEEIVGEITDEYDKDITPVEEMDDGTYLIDAKTIIEDVNDQLDISLPTEEFETIGGYVYGLTGHIPTAGETLHTDGITITVEKILRQRITKLRIKKDVQEPATPVRGSRESTWAP